MFGLALALQFAMFILIVSVTARMGPKMNIYNPLLYYQIFHFLVFVLRPFLVYALDVTSQYASVGLYPTDEVFLETLLVSTFGLVCFSLPFVLSKSGRIDISFNIPTPTRLDRASFYVTTAILSPLLVYSLYINRTQAFSIDGASAFGQGGIELQYNNKSGTFVFTNNTAYIVLAVGMCGTLALAYVWVSNFRPSSFVPLCSYIVFRMTLGSGRWAFFLLAVSTILVVLYRNQRRWPTARALVLGLVFIVIFSAIGQNRRFVSDLIRGSDIPADNNGAIVNFVDSPDFANFEVLAFIVNTVPNETGTYTFFTQYLEIVFKPIPRILWAGKPAGSPINLVDLNRYGNMRGRAGSAIGDGWVSLGWLGVAVELGLAGLVTRNFYLRIARDKLSPQRFFAFFMLLPLLPQWARDGGIIFDGRLCVFSHDAFAHLDSSPKFHSVARSNAYWQVVVFAKIRLGRGNYAPSGG